MTEQSPYSEQMPVVFISLGPGDYSQLTLEAYSM